ncbi:MAG: hypothetical protein ACI87C_002079 [Paraperlucidibaca sp.]|jgi:hypothetical protein
MDCFDIAKSIKNTQQSIDRLERRLTCLYLDHNLLEYERATLAKLIAHRAALRLLLAILDPQDSCIDMIGRN